MKSLKAATLLGLLGAFASSPAAAQDWTGWDSWVTFRDCGGSNFAVCFSADVYTMGNQIGVAITNDGPRGIVTRVGVVNVPDATTVDEGSVNPDGWQWDTTNGLTADGLPSTTWAYTSPPPRVGNGLGMGDMSYFSFAFDPSFDLETVGLAVHAQGFNDCSSKFGFWNVTDGGDYTTNDAGPDGYDDSCYGVPEPGSTGLIAAGLLGMAFLARRRGFQIESA